MVESTTKNYGWIKPEIQHSPATWGGFLNNDLDAIDALVFANQQAAAPIGGGALWFTATPPANWLICDGSSLDTTAYATLFAILGYTYGGSGPNFNLPNPLGKMPLGANATYPLATSGGAATVTLDATMIPAHTHTATQAAHGHAATQAAHAHAIATGSHSHSVSTGGHSHTLSAQVLTPSGGGNATAGAGWAFTSPTTNAVGDLGGSTNTVGNLGGNTDAQTPAITVPTAQPAITVAANTGGGLAHNNLSPYLALNFIIRYQ